MSKRLTLYLTDKSQQILGNAESLSGRVNSVISRYGRITDETVPPLTLAEWSFLADMLNGTLIEDNTGDYLWADIAESGKADGLAEKWSVDSDAFSERVRTLSSAARFAILEVIVRFWKGESDPAGDMAQVFVAAGAKISE